MAKAGFEIADSSLFDLMSFLLNKLKWGQKECFFCFYLLESFLFSEESLEYSNKEKCFASAFLVSKMFDLALQLEKKEERRVRECAFKIYENFQEIENRGYVALSTKYYQEQYAWVSQYKITQKLN